MKIKFFLVLVMVLAFLVASPFFLYEKIMLCDYLELDSYLTIGTNLGFNVDTDALYFGTVPPGLSASRSVYINESNCGKVKVIIKVEGEFKDWVTISDNGFILLREEGKSVDFQVNVPNDAVFGDYNSKVKFYFWKTF